MNSKNNQEYYINLKNLLIKYQKAYEANTPLIPDEVYDLLYKELQNLEEENPDFKDLSNISPTQTIGYNLFENSSSAKKYIKHLYPMLSLDHELGVEGLKIFSDKINRFLNTNIDYAFIAQPKIDGVSVALRYKNGLLQSAALRGDGYEGEDITNNILSLNIPIKYNLFNSLDFEIRGELYMPLSIYEKEFKDEFASARHAVSGSVRLLNVAEFQNRQIKLLIHGFAGIDIENIIDLYTLMQEIAKNFDIVPSTLCKNAYECEEEFKKWQSIRSECDYLMDGVVYKLNDLLLWKKLQYHSKSPRYAFALKFQGNKGIGKVKGVNWNVGRTGVITPVLNIEPTIIDGTQITKVTLHNVSEFIRFNPQIDDIAMIERAFDVIPYLIDIIPCNKESDAKPIVPGNCPCCGFEVNISDKFLICNNDWNCKEQAIDRLFHLLSRDAFDIDGLGLQKLNFLYEQNIVKKPADLFKLNQKCQENSFVLTDQEGWGKKSVDKLLINIEQSKTIVFSKFLYAIGIPGIGKSLAKKISHYCSNWNEFKAWIKQEMISLDGMGEKIKSSILEFISKQELWVLDLMQEIEILPDEKRYDINDENRINVVFTGKFSVSRQAMKQALNIYPFIIVSDSISSKTQYLIYGEDAGSKLKKAKELDIECLTEDQWNEKVKSFN